MTIWPQEIGAGLTPRDLRVLAGSWACIVIGARFLLAPSTAAAGFGIAAWHDGGKADPYAIIVLRSNGPKATAALLFT